ncbi:indole-3-acetaldehyde oxidase-like [Plakobranchus ocellatus]|uniref:Indole-3-acetaldehyde oxidase-like n=1 Tax=Plakobranchus ocellatus TaxID=259542 RepID=A0AAV4CDL6_9GAST|nr:indole-3-acetaldehyde oxidase-like [Plakobranchus ocellatus]
MFPNNNCTNNSAQTRPNLTCPVCSASHLPLKGSLANGVYACTCENCGHFFKFKALQDIRTTATFKVNGKDYTVGNEFTPSTTLNTFLRSKGISKGTKGMCYEGGCGVCLVAVTLYAPIRMKQIHYTVNSCLLELFSCDGMDITTIEGIGDPKHGLHPIQEQLAKHDGAQCGYCSPSQVMNMYGLLKVKPKPTVQDVEDYFDSTVCRCTGYRPILDAMKTFCKDAPPHLEKVQVDIEDLDAKLCKKTGNLCTGHCHSNIGAHTNKDSDNQTAGPVHIVGASAQWLKPTSMDQLLSLLKQHSQDNYRLVFGNTGFGVYPKYSAANYDVLIDTRNVMDLYGIDFDPVIVMGANLSLHNLWELFDRTQTDPSIPYGHAFSEHIKYIASTGVRNMACWAGNLMLKYLQPDFPSDIFLLFESIGSSLVIYDGDGNMIKTSLTDFLKMDMKGKVIAAVEFPTYGTQDIYIRTYKRGLRLQQCVAYVNAAFNFQLDAKTNYTVKKKPTILFGGISSTKIHAEATEQYLTGKALGDPLTLKGALATLEKELVPEPGYFNASYRKALALSLFYKYVLDVCKVKASPAYVSGGLGLTRTPVVGTQDYGTKPEEFPVSKPMPKLSANYLTSGTAQFIDDLAGPPGMLFAVPVLSTIASGSLDSIDPTQALEIPGVVAFLKASDIPAGGVNNWRPKGIYNNAVEELLSSGPINYAGQPIGIIVADNRETATAAAEKVKITYKDVKTPIVTIQDAIKKQSFHPDPPKPLVIGDAKAAIAAAPHNVLGQIECGEQYHFHMETQSALCIPTDEGGMDVIASTQWLDGVLETVAQVLGIEQSQVTVETKRLGGGFGGKISQNFLISGLCALASGVLGLPVKMHLDIHANMKMCGMRNAYFMTYTIGCDDSGKLLGIEADLFPDLGFSTIEGGGDLTPWLDNAYYCPNWLVSFQQLKTNKAMGTACRAPGSTPAIFFMESMIEHVARYLGKDELAVRQANLYVNGQKTITQRVLQYCTLKDVVAKHVTDTNYTQRKADIELFNKNNRWKKRGLALMPNMFGISWFGGMYTTQLMVYHGDGSVAIAHGGIDMGQGINTKVIQVCAYELNIPMEKIRVKKSSTVNNANSATSGGSITSELACKGVIECCKILTKRMAPVKESMQSPTWEELVAKCYEEQIDMTVSYMTHPANENYQYMCFSAATVEAEIDVLTGQYQFPQMDMLYDCGDSMNPELDIGQAEGGFIMGMGYHLTEQIVYDEETGQILNAGTWNYKPPLPKDLPMKFNFKFQRNATNPLGVLGSKAVAEPALTMSTAALLAVKHAVESARADAGQKDFFALNAPATPEKVQRFCKTTIDQYTFGK